MVHGGENYHCKVPYSAFDREDLEEIRSVLVPMTVLRKDRNLTEQHRQRVSLDIISRDVELGEKAQDDYVQARDSLIQVQKGDPIPSRYKAARLGKDGCCGKGCNGCLIFTHDPVYARARELYKKKKIGEKLEEHIPLEMSL